jgi:hypothetical protein
MKTLLYGSIIALVQVGVAGACPLCDQSTGREVFKGIFGANFTADTMVLLLPFLVLMAGAAVVHQGPPCDPDD